MSVMSAVGVLAGLAVIVALAPQPLRIWRTRSLAGISVAGSGILFVNEAGWFMYGATGGYGASMATSLVAGSLKVWQFALPRPRWSMRSLGLVAGWMVAVALGVVTGTLGVVLAVLALRRILVASRVAGRVGGAVQTETSPAAPVPG